MRFFEKIEFLVCGRTVGRALSLTQVVVGLSLTQRVKDAKEMATAKPVNLKVCGDKEVNSD